MWTAVFTTQNDNQAQEEWGLEEMGETFKGFFSFPVDV